MHTPGPDDAQSLKDTRQLILDFIGDILDDIYNSPAPETAEEIAPETAEELLQ